MTLQEFTDRVRRMLPQSGSTTDMSDATIQSEIQRAVVKVNLAAQCYKTYVNVANVPQTVAGVQIYSLSAICPGYLTMSKSGVWWCNTNGQYLRLWAKTIRWLDNFLINWRNQSPGFVPTWYWHDGDQLCFYPPSNQQSTNANKDFRVHYLLKPAVMTSPNNYPWTNGTTEFTALMCFDDAICDYALMQLCPAVFDKEGRNYYAEKYKDSLKVGIAQVKRQSDLVTDYDYYVRIDATGGFLPS